MAYVVNRYDGTILTTVEDGTVNQTLDVRLVGKNYAGYGEIENENLVFMLENFARDIEPQNPIRGQVWYDTLNKKLKFFTGDEVAGKKVWKTTGTDQSDQEPANPTEGDLWFDTSVRQLKVRTETGWLVIGPQVAGSGVTQMVSRLIKGTDNILHPVIAATIEDEVVYIISKEANIFTVDPTDVNNIDLRDTFSVIGKGLTLSSIGSGTEALFRGTATNSQKLEGIGSAGFIQVSSPNFVNRATFSNLGFNVGAQSELRISVENSNAVIQASTNSNIELKIQDGSVVQTPMVITKTSVEPSVNNTYDLGTSTKKWKSIFVENLDGIASKARTLFINGSPNLNNDDGYKPAAITNASWTIAARDQNGNIRATEFNGIATSARYADLAEKYLADEIYPIGTVVMIGGEKEVTSGQYGKRALGVVSENPAFMMNCDLENGTYIALKGRVPVYVQGPVFKGAELIAGNNGVATVVYDDSMSSKVFAIALEDDEVDGIRLIECVVL